MGIYATLTNLFPTGFKWSVPLLSTTRIILLLIQTLLLKKLKKAASCTVRCAVRTNATKNSLLNRRHSPGYYPRTYSGRRDACG